MQRSPFLTGVLTSDYKGQVSEIISSFLNIRWHSGSLEGILRKQMID